MPHQISISGLAGSWKSSAVNAIVKQLWYQTADVWQIFRKRAVEKWMTISQYDKYIETHPQEDIQMENDFTKLVQNSNKDIIVSRRLSFYKLPSMTSIRLDVSPEVGAQRVFAQDRGKQEPKYQTVQDALIANKQRMERFKNRIMKVYNIDFTNISNYTHIIHTDNKTISQVNQEILDLIQKQPK